MLGTWDQSAYTEANSVSGYGCIEDEVDFKKKKKKKKKKSTSVPVKSFVSYAVCKDSFFITPLLFS